MILSRSKPATGQGQVAQSQQTQGRKQVPKVEDFLATRDYTGALTVLEFGAGKGNAETEMWIGYCAFHLGDYKKAMSVYEALSHNKNPPEGVPVNLACCYFYLGMYPEADRTLQKAVKSRLKTRLQFHLAHKLGDEKKLMEYHQELEDVIEDQLSLASIHYLRSHYQEAIDIYKRILLDNREYLALNVYVALCYYKLDYYDVSQEVLAVYLQQFPDSAIAINLKACNHFRLYNGKAAETEMKSLMDQSSSSFSFGHDLIRHNLVVFRGGEGALQVLPSLVDVIPEARLNLVIYYLKQEDVREAYQLIKDLEPAVPQEYILKGVVNAAMGQENGSREHVKIAQQYFQLVGSSASECDTIPGRQCMASCFFLLRQFEDVLLYLSSIKSYFFNDDSFNFNFAQAQAAKGNYKEAEETFLMIQNDRLKNDYVYISHLARCYIMNKKPQHAWELYLKMETSAESFSLLQLIANDSYKMGQFWHAAKAFDMLERLDPSPEHWEGKRGACVGVFQRIVAGQQNKELLTEAIQLLRNTANSQVEQIIRVMKRWAKDNRINI
ncbi:Intraflagellar transport protein 56 [Cryptotermes secundus]|uniref:Intraflagellar transport protein 56 n=2 Tax=Cryptotermes secundus TaxID=105785 RepID=A0A2J7QEA5_9NEOP|nr:intraflagellar transport protein 56 isoform X1 [Cryptotermes secundus]PNF26920.1 Intraflagellar transport protein 56 [Cryptotermes secundus]